jgi:hypothetical protein
MLAFSTMNVIRELKIEADYEKQALICLEPFLYCPNSLFRIIAVAMP